MPNPNDEFMTTEQRRGESALLAEIMTNYNFRAQAINRIRRQIRNKFKDLNYLERTHDGRYLRSIIGLYSLAADPLFRRADIINNDYKNVLSHMNSSPSELKAAQENTEDYAKFVKKLRVFIEELGPYKLPTGDYVNLYNQRPAN